MGFSFPAESPDRSSVHRSRQFGSGVHTLAGRLAGGAVFFSRLPPEGSPFRVIPEGRLLGAPAKLVLRERRRTL